jgi:hypothetical protein
MRGRSPLGNPLLWIVAAFVLPEVVKKCKPFAKVVGDTLVSAGEAFRKASEETPKTEAAPVATADKIAEAAPEESVPSEPFKPEEEH